MNTTTYKLENIQVMFLLPLGLLLLAPVLEYSGFDLWWVARFYDGQTWVYKHHWLFDGVIHTGGQLFYKFVALLWVAGFITINIKKELRIHRKPFLYILCATVAGPVIVGVGKQLTHIYTPWDLQRFNGTLPYIRLFDSVPVHAPTGHAFPAGHASSGYCFLSSYFILLHFRSPYRFAGLACGIVLGLIYGLGQQVRGAHFPSHDLFSLAICWSAALVIYLLFYSGADTIFSRQNFTWLHLQAPRDSQSLVETIKKGL